MKTVYYNGKVYCGEGLYNEAFSVENGIFVKVGKNKDLIAAKNDDDILVDLNGKFVCAGINDSHMHVLMYGYALNSVMLFENTSSLKDVQTAISKFITDKKVPKGNWVTAIGWNQDYFTDVKRMPNKFDIDAVAPDNPVIAYRCCEHCALLNSYALQELGIESESGLFFDGEMDPIKELLPKKTIREIKDYIVCACKALRSYGITSCQTDDFSAFDNVDYHDVIRAYKELEDEGLLSVRIYEQCNFKTPDDFKGFVNKGYYTGMGTDWFKIGPLKILGDGSLGARTAYLTKPYADDPNNFGVLNYTQEDFDDYITFANKNKFDVCVHAIGDACLDMVLDSFEKAYNEMPWEAPRHGIVHCQITRYDQLLRIARLKLSVYAQTIFLDYDIGIVYNRIGKERAEFSYSWKTLMKMGVLVSNGSDCPVELPNVIKGIKCATTRKTADGSSDAYLPDQAFTLEEAIDSYTICSAKQAHEDSYKGLIKEGYISDFSELKI